MKRFVFWTGGLDLLMGLAAVASTFSAAPTTPFHLIFVIGGFLTIKRLWGFAKVRYHGLAKNANRAFAMLAMLNIRLWGRPLTGEVRST